MHYAQSAQYSGVVQSLIRHRDYYLGKQRKEFFTIQKQPFLIPSTSIKMDLEDLTYLTCMDAAKYM